LCGVGGSIQKPTISGFGSIVYRLQQNNRKYVTGNSIVHTKLAVENVRVYCPTVESGWFYVRHRGKISVTGNTNFYGQPPTMAKHAQLPVEMIVAFQQSYFKAFPGIRKWHTHVAQTLLKEGQITTLLGRKRYFLDRLTEDSTLRKAIAYEPQSITADTIDEGLLNIWRKYPQVQLLLQVHDSILLQYPEHLEDELLPLLLKEIEIERTLNGGRKFTIPAEAMVGWNWGYASEDNADGLIKWKGKTDGRRRQKEIPVVHTGIYGRLSTISEPGDLSEVGSDFDDCGGTGEEGMV
jgi:hypothetical protein